jgi:hypothetical protein
MTGDKLMPKSVKTLLSATFNYPDINQLSLITYFRLFFNNKAIENQYITTWFDATNRKRKNSRALG